MSRNNQAENFRVRVKSALVHRRQTITGLAKTLGYARNTVSMSINRHIFPGVISAIKRELHLENN